MVKLLCILRLDILSPTDKITKHLQSLISQWEHLLQSTNVPEGKKYFELYERSKEILSQLRREVSNITSLQLPERPNIERFIGKLRAALLDLNVGMLSIERQVTSQIAVDLMQQAEALLTEGECNSHQHIPAAVLAGAVLEHFLRTLCSRQSPPIPLKLDNGNLKTLATLVNDLERAGLYDSVEKKQLRVWVEIRNFAAHGQFDKFKPAQVRDMIDWIREFIETHQADG